MCGEYLSCLCFFSALHSKHLLRLQMDGMRAGYNARVAHEKGRRGASLPHLSRRNFLFMSAVGDMDPLIEALGGGGAATGVLSSEQQRHAVRMLLSIHFDL